MLSCVNQKSFPKDSAETLQVLDHTILSPLPPFFKNCKKTEACVLRYKTLQDPDHTIQSMSSLTPLLKNVTN